MDPIAAAARTLADRAVEAARTLTRQGEAADDHQVVVERVAYAATEARVIDELVAAPAALADVVQVAIIETFASMRHRLEPVAHELGLESLLHRPLGYGPAPAAVEAIGARA